MTGARKHDTMHTNRSGRDVIVHMDDSSDSDSETNGDNLTAPCSVMHTYRV